MHADEVWLSTRPLANALLNTLSYQQIDGAGTKLMGRVRLVIEQLPEDEQEPASWQTMWFVSDGRVDKVLAYDVSSRYGKEYGSHWKLDRRDGVCSYFLRDDRDPRYRRLFPTLAEAAEQAAAMLRASSASQSKEAAEYDALAAKERSTTSGAR